MPDNLMKNLLTRSIFSLKTPSPDGSPHYQSGWDDGVEASIDEVNRTFDQIASKESVSRVKHSGPNTKFCVLCLSGEHERVDGEAQSVPQAVPAMSKAIRKKLRGWAYAAGYVESELDDAVENMYERIAQDIVTSLIAAPQSDGET